MPTGSARGKIRRFPPRPRPREIAGQAQCWCAACASYNLVRGLLIVVACLAATITAAAQSARAPEYEVKAAFLYNFAKFVEWPANAFAQSSAPLRICVLGQDPFGDTLNRIVQGKSISGRTIVNQRLQSPAEAHPCHILFISGSNLEALNKALQSTRDLPLLTVGESDVFLELGGVINFVLEQDRVRFEISLGAAESHRLKLSSKLLAVARAVKSGAR